MVRCVFFSLWRSDSRQDLEREYTYRDLRWQPSRTWQLRECFNNYTVNKLKSCQRTLLISFSIWLHFHHVSLNWPELSHRQWSGKVIKIRLKTNSQITQARVIQSHFKEHRGIIVYFLQWPINCNHNQLHQNYPLFGVFDQFGTFPSLSK